ncbi:hypothetical protein N9L68_08815 [bacterium]|nr:hypothetical protein [bacterium]
MVASKLVLKLVGRRGDYDDAIEEVEGNDVVLWLHVGLQYLSPFRPTIHHVLPADDLDETEPNQRIIYVRSQYRFPIKYVALDPLTHSTFITM